MTQKKAEKIAKTFKTIARKMELRKIQSSIVVMALNGQFEMTTKIEYVETIEALKKNGYLVTSVSTPYYSNGYYYKVEW